MSNEHIYICELYARTVLFVSKYTNTTMLELICTITIASSSSSSTVMTLEHCKQLLASYAIQTHRPLLDIHHLPVDWNPYPSSCLWTGIRILISSVNLILSTLLSIHLMLHISPHHSPPKSSLSLSLFLYIFILSLCVLE